MVRDKWKQKNIDLGLCRECGKPKKHNLSACCPSCAKKASVRSAAYKKKKREEWKAEGLCYQCGKAKETEKLRCNTCHDKLMDYNIRTRKDRVSKRKEDKTCPLCGAERYKGSNYCRVHWVEKIAERYKIKGTYRDILLNKLIDSGFRCFYTKREIVPGVNASIDHMTPTSCDGERVDDIDNLVWCDKRINSMKGNYTADDFIGVCRDVVLVHGTSGVEPVETRCCNGGR